MTGLAFGRRFRRVARRLFPVCAGGAILICAGCSSLSVRGIYSQQAANMQLESSALTGKKDADIDQTRTGVELGYRLDQDTELFADLAKARFKVDGAVEDLDADGYAGGIGARNPFPRDEGWGPDWGVRAGYLIADDSSSVAGVGDSFDFRHWEVEAHLGLYEAYKYSGWLIVAPHIGGFYRYHFGQTDINGPAAGLDDSVDYELEVYGGYAGVRLGSTTPQSIEVFANYLLGTEGLNGFEIAVGFRF